MPENVKVFTETTCQRCGGTNSREGPVDSVKERGTWMPSLLEGVCYTLTCDNCGAAFASQEPFPVPQLCPACLSALESFTERRGNS